jgi:hypothetical protein
MKMTRKRRTVMMHSQSLWRIWMNMMMQSKFTTQMMGILRWMTSIMMTASGKICGVAHRY